jgi:hypothetical protein
MVVVLRHGQHAPIARLGKMVPTLQEISGAYACDGAKSATTAP